MQGIYTKQVSFEKNDASLHELETGFIHRILAYFIALGKMVPPE